MVERMRNGTAPPARPAAAILLVIAVAALGTLSDSLIKHLGGLYPTAEVLFARMAVGLAWMGAVCATAGERPWRTAQPGWQALYAAVLAAAIALWFAALPRLPLADATAISFAAPVAVALMAGPLLGERLRRSQWAAVAVAFAGVLLINRPAGDALGVGGALALGSMLLSALSFVLLRRLGRRDGPRTTTFFATAAGFALSLGLAGDGWRWPAAGDVPLLLALGTLTTVAQLLSAQAYRMAPAPLLAPFDYARVLFVLAAATLVFGESIGPASLAGLALIVGGGLLLGLQESARPPEGAQ